MKLLSTCFLVAFLGLGCTDNRKEIIKIFQPVYNLKPVTTKVYTDAVYTSILEGGGDSHLRKLFLNSDTTFTFYNSEDNNNEYSFTGKWQFVNDAVILTPYFKKNISFHISLSKSTANPKVIFIIFDKTDKAIENFIIQPFNNKRLYNYNNAGDLTTDKNSNYKLPDFPSNFSSDSTGTIKLDKSGYDSLDFTKLYPLTRKRFAISTNNLPDTIKLIIDINAISLTRDKINFINSNLPPVKLLLRGERFSISFDY